MFTDQDYNKHFFVGSDAEAILADTANGTKFGYDTFIGNFLLTEYHIQSLKLKFLNQGVKAVQSGTKSFWLGITRDIKI